MADGPKKTRETRPSILRKGAAFSKKFHEKYFFFFTNFSAVSFPLNQRRGGNHVADSCLNSPGFRYRLQCSRFMAHRMVREEAARSRNMNADLPPHRAPEKTAINVLLRQAKEKQRNFVPVPCAAMGSEFGRALPPLPLKASMLALVLSLHARFHPLASHLQQLLPKFGR